MKILIVVGLLLTLTFQSFAQQKQRVNPDSDKFFYLAKAEKYRRMKSTGTVLTCTGSVLAIIGIATLSNATTTTNSYGYQTTTGNPEAGAIAFLAGSCALGAGIPLWIVGSHAQKKYERKLSELSAGMNMNRQQMGFSLRYRF